MIKLIPYPNGIRVNFRDRSGQQHQKRFRSADYPNPEKAAREYYTQVMKDIAAPDSRLIRDAIMEYCRRMERSGKKRPTTVKKDLGRLLRFAEWAQKEKVYSIHEVTPPVLRRFHDWYFENAPLYQSGRPRKHPGQPPKNTWGKYLLSLSAFFRDLETREIIESNPVLKVKDLRPGKIQEPETRWFTNAEITAIFEAVDELHDKVLSAYYRTLAYTGMRPTEAQKLQWRDIDIDRQTVLIQRETKTYRNRAVPLLPALKDFLLALPKHGHDKAIFARKDGTPYHSNDFYLRTLKKVLQSAGIPDGSLYSFRHSYGTMLGDLLLAKVGLGHSSTRTTERYSHDVQRRLTEAVKKKMKY